MGSKRAKAATNAVSCMTVRRTMTIELSDRQKELVDQLLAKGKSGKTVTEVIDTALRVLVDEQDQDVAIPDWHHDEVKKGLDAADRGDFVACDARSIIAAADAGER